MNIAVILAGGKGLRVGDELPKQFVSVFGRPIIAYTLDQFQTHPEIDAILIVCIEKYIPLMDEIVRKNSFTKVKWIAVGGSDFQGSVMNGISCLRPFLKPDDIVLFHYAASPFVTDDIISDGIKVAEEHGNSVSATPCYLLLGSNDDGAVSTEWVDRDKIMQLNSPQCFSFEYVVQLYDEAEQKGFIDKVEPHTTSLMYYMGRTLYFSKGNQTNIKITTREDIELFECYVAMKYK